MFWSFKRSGTAGPVHTCTKISTKLVFGLENTAFFVLMHVIFIVVLFCFSFSLKVSLLISFLYPLLCFKLVFFYMWLAKSRLKCDKEKRTRWKVVAVANCLMRRLINLGKWLVTTRAIFLLDHSFCYLNNPKKWFIIIDNTESNNQEISISY